MQRLLRPGSLSRARRPGRVARGCHTRSTWVDRRPSHAQRCRGAPTRHWGVDYSPKQAAAKTYSPTQHRRPAYPAQRSEGRHVTRTARGGRRPLLGCPCPARAGGGRRPPPDRAEVQAPRELYTRKDSGPEMFKSEPLSSSVRPTCSHQNPQELTQWRWTSAEAVPNRSIRTQPQSSKSATVACSNVTVKSTGKHINHLRSWSMCARSLFGQTHQTRTAGLDTPAACLADRPIRHVYELSQRAPSIPSSLASARRSEVAAPPHPFLPHHHTPRPLARRAAQYIEST